MNYPQKQINEAIQHARETYPAESVGFFYVRKGRMRYHRAINISPEPDRFMVAPDEYAAVESDGEIVALVHSHPNASALPSVLDQHAHAASGLDWLIVGLLLVDGEAETHFMPACTEQPSLYGRTFVHGVNDCYSFIRGWYAEQRGVVLLDFARGDDWWHKGENLYVENFAKAGFAVVDTPQIGDVLLMTIGAGVPNHAAIYAGDNQIEHHLYGRLSCRDVYGQFYRDRTTHALRYNEPAAAND